MNLGIIYSGKFGERFLCNIAFPKLCPNFGACGIDSCDFCKDYDFSSKICFAKKLPEPYQLGLYVENPEELVEKFFCDVLIAINVHPDILVSLPKLGEFKALIIPACDQKWCQPGLRNQLYRICSEIGIEFSSPKPFCSILPEGKILSMFCKIFKIGRPKFKAKLEGKTISDSTVLTSDPCGSAYYVAKKMRGFTFEKIEELYKEIHQHQCAYPCLASMERDPELKEAPFHLAGYIMVYSFCEALGIDATDFVPEHFRSIVKKVI
uniref:Thymidylate synthase n=1 Tax=Archaeoglobus fulgidus TaxID=2234 RepID=A0A7J2TJT6_ARCFL